MRSSERRPAGLLIALDVVGAAKLQRIDPQCVGELVEREFEHEGALHHAGRAEGGGRPQVLSDRKHEAANVVALVDSLHRFEDRVRPAVAAQAHHDRRLDAAERAIRVGAHPQLGAGLGPVPGR